MLKVEGINVSYGELEVVRDVSIDVNEGEIVSLVGSNAAGKTTTLLAISGLLRPSRGRITFLGERIDGQDPSYIVERGISLVPEGRRIFAGLTTFENLKIGAYGKGARKRMRDTLDYVYGLFPVLKERKNQIADRLSGGEQQMLAIGRALMSRPRLLMLDELSCGLAPRLAHKVLDAVRELNKQGKSILLVEQDVQRALSMSSVAYVLENGRISLQGKSAEVLENPRMKKIYLGL